MISGSVGQGGINRPDDVMAVQRLLSDLRIAAGHVPLDVDGLVGPKTIAAISDFQQQNPGLPVDGRIDPTGPTFTRLDEVSSSLYATIAQEQGFPILAAPTPPGTPGHVAAVFDDIRSDFSALAPAERVTGASRFVNPVPNLIAPVDRIRLNLLGAVQVVPLIIVLIFILALLIIITSNPIWQRAARETLKGLKDRMRLLSQKIRDAVQEIVDAIEGVIGGTRCAELCANEINKVKDLQQKINELLDRMPANDNDPDAMKQLQFQLARLLEQIVAAQADVVDCLQRNDC
ncbi:peptidoglycan-binding domain-containing protein [Streptomyces bobili]|uniref:peptidoglycan-binding domain-containing protein n=1 Tax=Streptomyces bobili TaxID=67280 RepID=UPI00343A1CEF